MRRLSAGVLAGLLVLALGWTAAPAPAAAASADPKVVLVVGATHGTTATYRSYMNEVATTAARYSRNVVKVYSPNATWSAVRSALQGASIVVYMGHGNGFPSPYSTTPNPYTQNGMGLNLTAGAGDYEHQVLRRELPRQRGGSRAERGGDPEPPLLRVGQLGARQDGADPRRRRRPGWTTSPPASSGPAPGPSSPRATATRRTTSSSSSRPIAPSSRSGRAVRGPTATPSRSRASAAPATRSGPTRTAAAARATRASTARSSRSRRSPPTW